jgi:multidrug efflux system membrane fusion protein
MNRFLKRNQSIFIALGITAALTLWLLSGTGATGSARDPSLEGPRVERPAITRVRVRVLEAQPVTRDVVIYGKTEAARGVTLRAEIDGRVVAIEATRGARVKKGDTIVRLDVRDREARLQQARALVDQRQIQYDAAKRLKSKNFQSQTNVAEAFANLEAARAAVARVEVEIANSLLLAPFDGVLHTRPVEIGDFIAEGKEVARIIELDPILVTGDVTQRELDYLEVGARGGAKLITGEQLEGVVRYVASEADGATRTYRVELEKSLDDNDKVVFHPVDIVRTGVDGIWVTGLPNRVRVITVGQGFVREGDQVEAQPEDQDA